MLQQKFRMKKSKAVSHAALQLEWKTASSVGDHDELDTLSFVCSVEENLTGLCCVEVVSKPVDDMLRADGRQPDGTIWAIPANFVKDEIAWVRSVQTALSV